jgi:phenylacetate-coenzyme A ligase PaaK-like adenylate-forming protein
LSKVLERNENMAINELTELETRVLKWISQSDFEEIPWSTKRAAKAFKVEEKEIYEALAAITSKTKDNIQIYYEDGEIRIVADDI